MSRLKRREVLALGAAGLAGCAPSGAGYFGKTVLPPSKTLTHTLPGEPDTLDPALSNGSNEFWVIPALLEGLTQIQPRLPEPMAPLATHYETNLDQTRFTFYLRGNPAPRGTAL